MAFQELEWHALDAVDFDDESDIPEVVPKSGAPVLNDMDPTEEAIDLICTFCLICYIFKRKLAIL